MNYLIRSRKTEGIYRWLEDLDDDLDCTWSTYPQKAKVFSNLEDAEAVVLSADRICATITLTNEGLAGLFKEYEDWFKRYQYITGTAK